MEDALDGCSDDAEACTAALGRCLCAGEEAAALSRCLCAGEEAAACAGVGVAAMEAAAAWMLSLPVQSLWSLNRRCILRLWRHQISRCYQTAEAPDVMVGVETACPDIGAVAIEAAAWAGETCDFVLTVGVCVTNQVEVAIETHFLEPVRQAFRGVYRWFAGRRLCSGRCCPAFLFLYACLCSSFLSL